MHYKKIRKHFVQQVLIDIVSYRFKNQVEDLLFFVTRVQINEVTCILKTFGPISNILFTDGCQWSLF